MAIWLLLKKWKAAIIHTKTSGHWFQMLPVLTWRMRQQEGGEYGHGHLQAAHHEEGHLEPAHLVQCPSHHRPKHLGQVHGGPGQSLGEICKSLIRGERSLFHVTCTRRRRLMRSHTIRWNKQYFFFSDSETRDLQTFWQPTRETPQQWRQRSWSKYRSLPWHAPFWWTQLWSRRQGLLERTPEVWTRNKTIITQDWIFFLNIHTCI